jgi:ribose transport system substrate-binding protein
VKKLTLIVLILAILVVSGCGSDEKKEKSTPVPTPAPYTIALVMKTLTNPFFVEMEKGARQAEQDMGIQLIVRTAAQETSIEQQIQIVDELIAEKVNAIVIAPGDSLELIPVLKKAQDAGIVVVNIDNRLDQQFSQEKGLVNVPFISVNNEQGAYLSAKVVSDLVKEPTEALIFEGIRSAGNAQDRKAGAERAFAENSNITVVASETANWKIDEAYTLAQTLFDAHPNVKVVFCANDMMALGVVQYLQETGRKDVLVAGYDALDEAKQAVKDGTMVVTIDQQAARQGYAGVDAAVKLLKGETVEPEVLVDVLVVTQETLQ